MSITLIFKCEDTLFKCYTSNTITPEPHQEVSYKSNLSCTRKIQDRCETKELKVVYLRALRMSIIMAQLLELSEPILKPAT